MNSGGKRTRCAGGGQVRGQVWWKWQQQMKLEGSWSGAWVPGKGGGHSLEGSRTYRGDFPEEKDLVILVKACSGGCGGSMGIRVLN